jgi:hypothetical protein
MDFKLLQVGLRKVSNVHFDCIILTRLYHCQIRVIGQICQDLRDIEYFRTDFKYLFLEI